MKLYGYPVDDALKREQPLTLSEVSIVCSVQELERLRAFLAQAICDCKDAKPEHRKSLNLHWQFWNKEWKDGDGDIVVFPGADEDGSL